MAIKPKTAWLQVRIDPEVLAAFHAENERFDVSSSDRVRRWVYQAVKQAEKRRISAEWGVAKSQGRKPTGEALKPFAGVVTADAAAGEKGRKRKDRGRKSTGRR